VTAKADDSISETVFISAALQLEQHTRYDNDNLSGTDYGLYLMSKEINVSLNIILR